MGSSEELELYAKDSIDAANPGEATYHARHTYVEEYVSEPRQGLYRVGFDMSCPPFDNRRVRRAFVMAVDREKLADEVLDGFMHAGTGGVVPSTIPGHSPGIGLPFDPAQARQLMAQAGYPDGQGLPMLEMGWHRPSHTLEYLKSEWMDNLNVEVMIVNTDWENIMRTHLSKHVYFMGHLPGFPDPEAILGVGLRSWKPNWKHETYDQLLKETRRTLDQSDRIRLYQEADKILIEEAVVFPIVYIHRHFLIKPWVKFPIMSFESWFFKDIILEPH